MRQYRGKRIDNGEWVYGPFATVDSKAYILHGTLLGPTPDDGVVWSYNEVIPDSVGQQTGIKDKNDIEIYGSVKIDGKMSKGGDIVRYMDARNMEVFYSTNGYVGWKLKRKPNHGKGSLIYMLYNHEKGSGAEEIVGNQWDNPKLMEQK